MKMDTARLKLGENKFMKLQELIGKIESLRVIFPEACFAWRVATNHEIPRSLLRGGSFKISSKIHF
jgi:hypothetical protein